jgi:hypothetical protein
MSYLRQNLLELTSEKELQLLLLRLWKTIRFDLLG